MVKVGEATTKNFLVLVGNSIDAETGSVGNFFLSLHKFKRNVRKQLVSIPNFITRIPNLIRAYNKIVVLVSNVLKERKIKARPYVEIFKVFELRATNGIAKRNQLLISIIFFSDYDLA